MCKPTANRADGLNISQKLSELPFYRLKPGELAKKLGNPVSEKGKQSSIVIMSTPWIQNYLII